MPTTLQTLARLQQISDPEWSKILKELTLYAEFRLDKIGFEPRSELDSVNGEDFAMEAIKKVFSGERNWDFDERPDLLIHLKLVVKSLIWNHIKASLKAKVKLSDLPVFETAEGTEDFEFENLYETNPEDIEINEERWSQLESSFDDDIDGFIFFSDWLDEIPPREIVKKYNAEINDVNNAIKRGKTYVKKIYSN